MSMRSRWVLLAIVVLFVVVPTWPWFHIGAGIEGRVIDAETGEPLEGVVVMARWQLKSGWIESQPYRQLQLLEAVTDRRGRYSFPWWGPRVFVPWAHLNSSDPLLVFFKSGYRVLRKHNGYLPRGDRGIIRRSKLSGQEVPMLRYSESSEEYKWHLEFSVISVLNGIINNNDPCALTKLPRLLRALRRDSDRLVADGVSPPYGAGAVPVQRLRPCASASDFFLEYWR